MGGADYNARSIDDALNAIALYRLVNQRFGEIFRSLVIVLKALIMFEFIFKNYASPISTNIGRAQMMKSLDAYLLRKI